MNDLQAEIISRLNDAYGNIGSGLRFTTPFELLVATILSAQSTDVRVNMVTPALFEKYPTAFEMSTVSEEILAKEINSIGLYRNKSKSIINTSKMLVEKYDGNVPADRELLQELPGVGRKTANVVLCNAFHIPAFAVDTHVYRVSQRLGFAKHKNVEGVEKQLMQVIPPELWCDSHHLFIWHGRKICKAQRPLCNECCVKELCPYFNSGDNSK
ncbi:MAG: endonuclease III [Peptococcaceae bacterium]|nr:endonuclease III [Peptococcaceae bacterium]